MKTVFYLIAALSFVTCLAFFILGMITSEFHFKAAGAALPFISLMALFFGDISRG